MESQFLDFISNEVAINLNEIKKNIVRNGQCQESPFWELSNVFIEKFGKCFEGEIVSVSGPCLYLNTLCSVARYIGLAYLKQGEETENIQSLNIALAFFQSVPKEAYSYEGTDHCIIDYVEIAKKDKENIEKRELIFQQFSHSNPSKYFK